MTQGPNAECPMIKSNDHRKAIFPWNLDIPCWLLDIRLSRTGRRVRHQLPLGKSLLSRLAAPLRRLGIVLRHTPHPKSFINPGFTRQHGFSLDLEWGLQYSAAYLF